MLHRMPTKSLSKMGMRLSMSKPLMKAGCTGLCSERARQACFQPTMWKPSEPRRGVFPIKKATERKAHHTGAVHCTASHSPKCLFVCLCWNAVDIACCTKISTKILRQNQIIKTLGHGTRVSVILPASTTTLHDWICTYKFYFKSDWVWISVSRYCHFLKIGIKMRFHTAHLKQTNSDYVVFVIKR